MSQNEVVPFSWGEIALSAVVYIEGVPHPTGPAIGEWLEYSDPRTAINTILNRNSYIEEFSVDVKLTSTDGKNYDSRVYHPIGFYLVVMESGQPKAQQFKVAVARFMYHFSRLGRLVDGEEVKWTNLMMRLVAQLTKSKDAFEQKLLTSRLQAVCLKLGQPMPELALIGKDPAQLALEGM